MIEICGEIADIETFAVGNSIRELPRLRRLYGKGRWRKRKAPLMYDCQMVKIRRAEIRWYEASGIGKKEFKIKGFID